MKSLIVLTAILLICGSVFAAITSAETNVFAISIETLPVVLSSFSASITGTGFVSLRWTTESETNISGYYVYRNNSTELSSSNLISGPIQPTNSSSQHSYSYLDGDILQSGQYYYWLQSQELNGISDYHGPISILVNLEGYDPEIPEITMETGLCGIYPNPFNPSTTISYQLQSPSEVKITIHNLRGQIMQSMVKHHSGGGIYSVVYNGKDANSNPASSGVYYVVMQAGKSISTKKIVLMK